MSGTLASMRRKIERTRSLGTVVHTMKSLAAAHIGQMEEAVRALRDYDRTLRLGLYVCLRQTSSALGTVAENARAKVVVFGSDQGLVGAFNEDVVDFAEDHLRAFHPKPSLYLVGNRLFHPFRSAGFQPEKIYRCPSSVGGITSLLGALLPEVVPGPLHLIHNQPAGPTYETVGGPLLPLDDAWVEEMTSMSWPSGKLPETLGDAEQTLQALIGEYLFVSLFKACAESLAAEHASRLAAMQRAERKIEEHLSDLQADYHRIRQASIDEELFDILAVFEALKKP